MTHDNHPTAAPLTVEHINLIKWQIVQCNKLAHISEMQPSIKLWMDILSFVSLSLARPVPSDIAEDVKSVKLALHILAGEKYDGLTTEAAQQASRAELALGRIVAHLPQSVGVAEIFHEATKDVPPEEWAKLPRDMSDPQPRDAASSGDALEIAAQLLRHIEDDGDCINATGVAVIQQALDQARAEAYERAASEIEPQTPENDRDGAYTVEARSCAALIRALIPAQLTNDPLGL